MKIKDSFYYTPFQLLEKKKVSFADYSKNKNYYTQLAALFEDASSRSPHTQKEISFILNLCKKLHINNPIFLDAACGTGRHARILSKKGHPVYGIDSSLELLTVARKKDFLTKYIKADLRTFTIARKFDCIFSLWEAYTYLSTKRDLVLFLTRCFHQLNPNGILILDSRNFWKKGISKSKIQSRNFKSGKFDIDLLMNKRTLLDKKVHDALFIYFIRSKKGLQRVVVDQELIRIWSAAEISKIAEGKFKLINIYGNFDGSAYRKYHSDRMIFVFKKK